jgi:hypothetical protein
MTIDRARLVAIFEALGEKLTQPATICLIGSSPGIVSGQPDRQSADVDIWRQSSSYDDTEFRRACRELHILFDPKGEVDPDAIYVQIVRSGIVDLPQDFETEILGQYGKLKVIMPAPAVLSATKLARGEARDLEDVAWWIKERALSLDQIKAAIASLPNPSQRETAGENMVLTQLIVAEDRK